MVLAQSSAQHLLRLGIIVVGLACLLMLPDGAIEPAYAEDLREGLVVIRGALQSEPVSPFRFDGDLRDLPEVKAWKPGEPIREIPRVVIPRPQVEGILPRPVRSLRDPLLKLQEQEPVPQGVATRIFSTPKLIFEGTPFTGALPPDTIGDVGPNHYIQMVNGAGGSVFAIYDKDGTLLAGPANLQTLWGAGGACATGEGDPIVLYDRLADRWLMSEFASTGNHLCVYVSQTPDPVSGGWFNYDFPTPNFPDYPKYAVWPDAYYVSSNEPSPAAYALDRDQMLLGQPATFQRFTAPVLAGFDFNALTPSDLDGSTLPPVGSPNYFMRHRDDEAHNPGSNDPDQDFLEIWEFHVDFADPANSTFTGPTNIEISEFDSDLCGLLEFFCFPQPDTTNTLDPLREVIMWRLQYRNFGTHETMVGNFVTDVDGTDHGGIRWFELRKTGSDPWTLFQEGTHAPDQNHRWMGSIAMDKAGSIALGYSVSSDSVSPSIRYAGRLAGDPLGQLPRGEWTLIDGGGSQTSSERWGDYSSMNVDPADDCTFWYTNEYIPDTDENWKTLIGSFRFQSCLLQTDLVIAKTDSPDPVAGGTNLAYTLTVTNNGPDDATGVIVTDLLSSGVTFVSAGSTQGTCAEAGGTVTCNLGDIDNGATAMGTIVVTTLTSGTITNTAGVTSNETDPDLSNNTATENTQVNVNAPPVGVIDTPTGNVTINRGQSINFTGTGTDPDGHLPLAFAWDFGGGAPTSTQEDPGNVTFNTAGTFTVTFTATDSLGLADPTPDTRTITVNMPPDGVIDTPTGDVTIKKGQSINFTGIGTDPEGQVPLTFTWTFDEGAPTSAQENPGEVTFDTVGTFIVTFIVTNTLGLTDPTPDTRTITVNEPSGDNYGPCFIATTTFGSPMAKKAPIQGKFRDAYLLTNRLRQVFVDFY